MRVFITGASGFVGSAIVKELIDAGHKVLGLARSDKAAASVAALGAEVHRGDMDDLNSLRRGTAAVDGVIHTAFNHDFSKFKENCENDRQAIEALGTALEGSDRPLLVTSGVALLASGRAATEDDAPEPHFPRVSEAAAIALAERGVRASTVRLPPSTHGHGDHGFVPTLIGIAREKGVSAFVGDGANRWPGVHRLDAARLFRLVVEQAQAGSRWHGVGDEGVPFRDIAEVIGRQLNLPATGIAVEQVQDHFGFLAPFAALDDATSSELTQKILDWHPMEKGLLADLDGGHYFGE